MSRPIEIMNYVMSGYNSITKEVNNFIQMKGRELPKWDDWCFLPLCGWMAISLKGEVKTDLTLEELYNAELLSSVGTWAFSKGVYKFDDEVFKSIVSSKLESDIPSELFYRLPEWGVYIETKSMSFYDQIVHGVFAHLECDVYKKRGELRILLDLEKDGESCLMPLILHINNSSIKQSIKSVHEEIIKEVNGMADIETVYSDESLLAEQLTPFVLLILYLCSNEPDVQDKEHPDFTPQKATPKKTKKGIRFFMADNCRSWEVGSKIGQKIRDSHSESLKLSGSKRPHLRRAHWHGYWKGSRKGDREYILKWIQPMFVGSVNIS